jgi:DNA-binding winged helix-turn-helix (wHTH) protein
MNYILNQHFNTISNKNTKFTTRLGIHEYKLLEILFINHGVTIKYHDLIDYAWRGKVVSRGSLTKAISSLRLALNDNAPYSIIKTIPRQGYCFDSDAVAYFKVD